MNADATRTSSSRWLKRARMSSHLGPQQVPQARRSDGERGFMTEEIAGLLKRCSSIF
ncbi:hypothetical protein JCM18909_2942 [Cutibacterium acnes JCM 18909]|nr:hypothetical protein JCM18909_2942 [Cutibacterium acnes JCM 18909]